MKTSSLQRHQNFMSHLLFLSINMLLFAEFSFCILEAAFIKEDRVVLLFDKSTYTYCNNPNFITINGVPVGGTNMIFQFDYNGLGNKYTMISLP